MSIKDVVKISQNLKLLYIEDDVTSRASTLEMLTNFFSDISIAVDGLDGYEQFTHGNFDIILSDINMPKLNGIDMLHRIRDVDKEIPVLFLSAYNEVSYLLDGIKFGVDGYIIKPLELNQFIVSLKKVTDKILLKKENEEYKQYLEREVLNRTEELDKKLHYDALTGLLSRYSFFKDIKLGKPPILLIIDINKFKIINEIYGTDVGSIVLQKFAEFLENFSANKNYKVYRLSGDEFALCDYVEYIDADKYTNNIEEFFELLNELRIEIDNDTITVDATIGMSSLQEDIFESAKIALDYAKNNRKLYAVYSKVIDNRDEDKNALKYKSIIKSAIEEKRVRAAYQPIVNAKKEILKYETLIRIKEADSDRYITPYYFLDIAMKTGLYDTLSSIIILNALAVIKNSSHTLSINFTYRDIKNSTLIYKIENYFKDFPELGSRTVIEITEDQSIENYEDVKNFIKKFRHYGVLFAIDDFGSGYSNFEHILEISPDYLKIDGSLIKDMDSDEKAYVLVKAIVGFSHELNIKVIAEYVHSERIFKMLRELDVDEFQGFYFYEPLMEICDADD